MAITSVFMSPGAMGTKPAQIMANWKSMTAALRNGHFSQGTMEAIGKMYSKAYASAGGKLGRGRYKYSNEEIANNIQKALSSRQHEYDLRKQAMDAGLTGRRAPDPTYAPYYLDRLTRQIDDLQTRLKKFQPAPRQAQPTSTQQQSNSSVVPLWQRGGGSGGGGKSFKDIARSRMQKAYEKMMAQRPTETDESYATRSGILKQYLDAFKNNGE